MSASEAVKIIYKNVLGRTEGTAPTDTEVNYWANEINSGHLSKTSVINAMLNSARTYTNDPSFGWVATLLENKVSVGRYVANDQGITYLNPTENISLSMATNAAITPSDTSKALALLGLKDQNFTLTLTHRASLATLAQIQEMRVLRSIFLHP